jgi:hypothetical protein
MPGRPSLRVDDAVWPWEIAALGQARCAEKRRVPLYRIGMTNAS